MSRMSLHGTPISRAGKCFERPTTRRKVPPDDEDHRPVERALADARTALGAGDDTVSAADPSTMAAAVERSWELAGAAKRHAQAARQAALFAGSIEHGDGLRSTLDTRSMDRAVDSAAEGVATALAALQSGIQARDSTIGAATWAAQEGGLVAGECDPTAPRYVLTERSRSTTRPVVVIDDEAVRPTAEALTTATREALATLGVKA